MCEVQPSQSDIQLVLACEKGNIDDVRRIIEEGEGDPCFQDFNSGMSLLMLASGNGHIEVVNYLLAEGAPWNAVDRNYLCAGDYAARNGHQDCIDTIMNHAVMSELLLSMSKLDSPDANDIFDNSDTIYSTKPMGDHDGEKPKTLNATYLSSRLEYNQDRLMDTSTQLAVMMDWETPLMALHAAWICHANQRPIDKAKDLELRVLNVGFGMGIVDKAIQEYKPTSHVIIEAHDEVLKKLTQDNWPSKPGVRIMKDRWQDAIPKLVDEIQHKKLEPFDGIFFDTYCESDSDLREFHSWLPKLLRPKSSSGVDGKLGPGRYSFYNGLCPDNVFFHGVACETLRLGLRRLGLSCTFEPIPVDVDSPELWKGIAQRYWYFDTYYLPKCTLDDDDDDDDDGQLSNKDSDE